MIHAKLGADPYRVDIVAGGHPLAADEGAELGGRDVGPSPFDLVLSGLAACTLITLRMYAGRKGWDGVDIAAQLVHRVADGKHLIDRRVQVSGAPDTAAIERLRDIVERTPVTLALKAGFAIETKLDEKAAA